MKILNYLTALLFIASAESFTTYGQGYQLTGSQSNMVVTDCDSIIDLNVSMEVADSSGGETFQIITQGTNPQTSSLVLYVNWGDGNASTHTGSPTGIGSGIVFSPPLTHVYPTFDDYTIHYHVSNPQQNSSFAWDSLYYTYANCDSTTNPAYDFCLSGKVFCDQDSNGVFSAGDQPLPNALINFSYNGSSWTASADQNGHYSTTYTGNTWGSTTVQVSQNWLYQNGYGFQSSPFTVWADTCGNQPALDFPVNCYIDTTTPPSYDFCLSGTVYCDQDTNGIFSAGDQPLPNALINFSYNGSSWSASADQNGHYSTTYTGISLGGSTTIQIDQNWLYLNGYGFQSSPSNVWADTCGNQPALDFPVNCYIDTITSPYYDFCLSGTVYCDQDINGIFSAGDQPLPNALINFSNNVSSWTVSADQNGHYSTTYPGMTGSVTVQVDQNWLYMNGYGYQSNPSNLWSFNCSIQAALDFPVNCYIDTATPPSYDFCLSGTVYCDQDTNGVFSAGDQPLPNAPINFTYNGTNWTTNADQNGHYSTTYTGMNPGNVTTVQVDQNWLYLNGYGFQSSPSNVWADTCGNQPALDLAINCNIDTSSYSCFSAKIFCDANGNTLHEPGEVLLANVPVELFIGGTTTMLYSDSTGMISYCGWFNYFDTAYTHISLAWLNAQGYTAQTNYMFLTYGTVAQIPINCTPPVACANLYANVTPWIGYYQNYSNTIKISYGNYGPSNSGPYQVSLTFPAGVTPMPSTFLNQSYTITGNTITWNFAGAAVGYNFSDYVNFSLTGGITNGTNHAYTISITPTGSVADCDSSNNSSTLNMIVGQSYDPNDKTVHNQKYLDPMEADVLTYVIRFQNTGTAPAQDVNIIDTISSNLDFNTLEILETSHNLNVVALGNNVVKFDYPQIWLADSNSNEAASHGYVIYKIKEKANNPIGSSIENTAYIYFDWNPAIVTNTTININQTNALNEIRNEFSVYPNPFTDQIRIQGTTWITGYEFIDAAGKVILKNHSDSKEILISTAELTAGLYYLNILSEGGNSIQKIVKH